MKDSLYIRMPMSYSLDEIISALESSSHTEFYQDAVKYLKEYRDITNNNPLTWDELMKMVGEPIWVVYGLDGGEWLTVYGHDKNESTIYCTTASGIEFWLYKYQQGRKKTKGDRNETWAAYRTKQC